MWHEVWLEFCHKPIRPTKPNPVIEIDLIQVVLGIPTADFKRTYIYVLYDMRQISLEIIPNNLAAA